MTLENSSELSAALGRLSRTAKHRSKNYLEKGRYNGDYLFGEGYENVSYPGSARVAQYRLFSDGVLRLNILMEEEGSSVESTELYTLDNFLSHLETKPQKSLDELVEEIRLRGEFL